MTFHDSAAASPATVPTADLVAAYSARFTDQHSELGVVSPLGVWLLLALLAPACPERDRAHLEQVLGTTAWDASARAAALLSDPHPALAAALAAWSKDGRLSDAHAQWVASLPVGAHTGPVPDQDGADRWARAVTNGVVDRFPVQLDGRSLFVLASALAATVPWSRSLSVVPAKENADSGPYYLGGAFGDLVDSSLSSGAYTQGILWTTAAGLVGVHVPSSDSGVQVISVIAEPDVASAAVHRAALEVSAQLAEPAGTPRWVSLFDLPLAGHAWSMTQRTVRRLGATQDRSESVSSVLPAWSSSVDLDVLSAPGVEHVMGALNTFALPADRPVMVQARQAAVAKYTQDGFTAAAVTAISFMAGSAPPTQTLEVLERRAVIRFNRPHAVLAVAGYGPRAWEGVPVFSAWVATPDEVEQG